ncbi:GEM-like protein 5 [Henckelia pumila]|uniref:GEM-like protein 5 n=1 Tax=Henckelia pumila TaxID=405737 RepID=UPI003C6DC548
MASPYEDHVAKESHPPSATATTPHVGGEAGKGEEYHKAREFEHREKPGSSTTQQPPEEDVKKWGTHEMGAPAAPNVHPDNQQAAHWQAQGSVHQYQDNQQQPYVIHSPIDKPADSPYEYVVNMFNSWSNRADGFGCNIWKHLKTGQSLSGTAWGKVNLTAKAITGGGFEPLFRQIFSVDDPNEKLRKTFACYLSTTTGPVAGTIYLSTARVAFCSDRPLTFRAPSGQDSWTYYKISVPIGNVEGVNPVVTKENPPEKYIQMITVDRHEFWFMGFVSFEKAINHLLDAVSGSRASTGNAANSGGFESNSGGFESRN